jgi:hypothetical protein
MEKTTFIILFINTFIADITNWLTKSASILITLATMAGFSVYIRATTTETNMTNKRKLVLFLLSFGIGMAFLVIGQGIFGYYGGGAVGIGGALVGEKIVTWLIVNQEVIMEQIAKRFKINIRK